MRIELATVVPGSETLIGQGATGALRCVLTVPDGSKRAGVLKRGPVGQVAAEAFSALLLRAWGLNVPDPYLVDEGGAIAFASADLSYPNLKQFCNYDALPAGPVRRAVEYYAAHLACGFASTPLAIAADEAIDNRDRNLGNILWDGREEAWIDHAFSLGQGPSQPDLNKLCLMAVQCSQHERLARASVSQALVLDQTAAGSAQAALPAPLGSLSLSAYVAPRITSLASRVLARFPQPSDLLSPDHGN